MDITSQPAVDSDVGRFAYTSKVDSPTQVNASFGNFLI